MFLTYATSIWAPFFALPILKLFICSLQRTVFSSFCGSYILTNIFVITPFVIIKYIEQIMHFNVDFSVYNSLVDNRSIYVMFLDILHGWKSWQRQGIERLKIPRKTHKLNRPNVLVYVFTNTDRITTLHPPASLRAVFNI